MSALTRPYREELLKLDMQIRQIEQQKAIVRIVALTEISVRAAELATTGIDPDRLMSHLLASKVLD